MLLILVIIILAGVLAYTFLVKPMINERIQQKQIDAYNLGQVDLVNAILVQIQQTGYVTIPVGNSSLTLVPAQ